MISTLARCRDALGGTSPTKPANGDLLVSA